ncbi:MAG TPA: proton-conducting transporter membrane subunit, partial [bacterium]|nr:proton-conducting transporter membrane subunit [bacterium]
GVLFALAQHDLKRLLAYHSVENIGIIALGLGIGMLGLSYGHRVMATAGFLGAILHVMNHAIFKSLLFMSVGSVLQATGTREMDHLGGLMKQMPVTAVTFLVGSLAICGLPPLNGFVSEFIIYYASFKSLIGSQAIPVAGQSLCLLVIGSLALIGGLALACFTKAFGVVFLGESRSEHTAHAQETKWQMLVPMIVLALTCFAIGILSTFVLEIGLSPVHIVVGQLADLHVWQADSLTDMMGFLQAIAVVASFFTFFFALLMALLFVRFRLLSKRKSAKTVTWDCGYAAPTPRMQYTSSSFVQPIIQLFLPFLRTKHELRKPEGYFPESAEFSSHTPDVYREHFYKPIFTAVESTLSKFHWIQHGRLNLYILSIVAALLVLLIWKL